MSDNNDLGAFLAGFVIGGLVGAATALILAPQSGEDMRVEIGSKSRELRDAGGERIQQYRDMADSYTRDYRDKAGNIIADTRSRVQETGGRVQEQARIVLDTGKERVAQVRGQADTGQSDDSEKPAGETGEDITTS
jgi:gas vesicle protein